MGAFNCAYELLFHRWQSPFKVLDPHKRMREPLLDTVDHLRRLRIKLQSLLLLLRIQAISLHLPSVSNKLFVVAESVERSVSYICVARRYKNSSEIHTCMDILAWRRWNLAIVVYSIKKLRCSCTGANAYLNHSSELHMYSSGKEEMLQTWRLKKSGDESHFEQKLVDEECCLRLQLWCFRFIQHLFELWRCCLRRCLIISAFKSNGYDEHVDE